MVKSNNSHYSAIAIKGSRSDSEIGNYLIPLKGELYGAVTDFWPFESSCRAKYLEPADKSTGSRLQNGSWSGVIGLLEQGDVDVSSAYLIMTVERLDAVDFTTPVLSTRYYSLFNDALNMSGYKAAC
jgi:hypothetical protein